MKQTARPIMTDRDWRTFRVVGLRRMPALLTAGASVVMYAIAVYILVTYGLVGGLQSAGSVALPATALALAYYAMEWLERH